MIETATRLQRTRELLARGIDEGLHLGAQLYVSLGGEPVADLAVGEARPGLPLSPDALMPWLSSSKPVTALAIVQLWERGRLELDDPVARHLPEFGVHGKERITLRHLLTHTGGIRRLDLGWPNDSWEEIVARVAAMRPEPHWEPGEKAGYHLASSWFILGEVVRRAGGRPFERFVREELFEPLGMLDCWIGMPAERYRAYGERVADAWDTAAGEPRPHGWADEAHATRPSPGGSGRGPMRQLGRLYEALLHHGALFGGGGRILSPQAVEAATARHRVGLFDQTFKAKMDWGLGFILDSKHYGVPGVPYAYGPHASRRTFGHSGYRSSTAFADPEHGLVVALAVNGTPSAEAHERRFDRLTATLYEELGLARAPAPETPDHA